MTENERLLSLFEQCLHCSYRKVEEDASFAIKHRGSCLTVFFQDSEGLLDWKHNLAFRSKPYGKGGLRCHGGFYRVFKAALPYLEKEIADPSVKKITLVGYSHGAALALLCYKYALDARADLAGKIEGFGFGTPRVFKKGLTKEEKARFSGFTYIKNIDDIVTHLPLWLFGYRHVKPPLLIGARGRYSMIDAHRPTSYQEELRRLGAEEEEKELVHDR